MSTIRIQPLTAQVVQLKSFSNNIPIITGTGFFLHHLGETHLVSAWHVFSGRASDTWQPIDQHGRLPDKLGIVFHKKNKLGHWLQCTVSLYEDDGSPLYFGHPDGHQIDVGAIRIRGLENRYHIDCFDMKMADEDMELRPAQTVSIVGFPADAVAQDHIWPVWKTGHIATEPEIDWNGRPCLLIDATTRPGMSGSPVLAIASGMYRTCDGATVIKMGCTQRFLGVYTARLAADAALGRVWKPRAIQEVIAAIPEQRV